MFRNVTSMQNLQSLIHPVALDEFESDYFEKRHLRIGTDDPERFLPLVSFHKLDEILGTFGVAVPDIKLVGYKRTISDAEYTWKKGMVDPARVSRLFAEGSTIVFNSLQDRVEPLHDLCSGLAEELGLRTQANIYLTPPASQGFAPHWDTHDVFVLQVEGKKQWRIYEENFPLPVESEKYRFQRGDFEPSRVAEEFTLHAGEVLYIPRGVIHSAVSSEEKSLHITLGINPYTWADLLRESIDRLEENDVGLRTSVPLSSEDLDWIHRELEDKVRTLLDAESMGETLKARREQSLKAFRPRKTDFLSQSLSASEITETDVVRPYPHVAASVAESPDSGRVVLTAEDREISFPVAARATLEQVFGEGQALAASDYDDDITLGSRKVVISRLIREGLVYKQSAEWREKR